MGKTMKPSVLIIHANGTNRDTDLAQAFSLAGAQPTIMHLNTLKKEKIHWRNYQILAIPGGFSYADTLSAGRMLALDLNTYFKDELQEFVASGKPVIGICNGFQALIKSGVLPSLQFVQEEATLTFNASGKFICTWVKLMPTSKKCLWTKEINASIDCPIAHGEGRLLFREESKLQELSQQDQIALCYEDANPNGSIANIAGLCNSEGNVLGLMPHPENHIYSYQYPQWTRGIVGNLGLQIFLCGVKYVS